MEQLELFNDKIIDLRKHLEMEKKKYELWAFIAGHGGVKSFTHGYLQCLNDIDYFLKS